MGAASARASNVLDGVERMAVVDNIGERTENEKRTREKKPYARRIPLRTLPLTLRKINTRRRVRCDGARPGKKGGNVFFDAEIARFRQIE